MPWLACSTSTSASITAGFLPPSSSEKRVMFCTAAVPTSLPVGVEPVNEILLTPGCATSAAPHSRPPVTTLNTPGGTPASSASSAIRNAVSGVSGEGLMTIVQPAASAGTSFHTAIIKGKFHGTMPATTPTGSLRVNAVYRTPGGKGIDTSSVSPVILVAQPAIYRTYSIVAPTSTARDTLIDLPWFRVSS